MADIVELRRGEKIDQWQVLEKLGEGGFGSVYKVKFGLKIVVNFKFDLII